MSVAAKCGDKNTLRRKNSPDRVLSPNYDNYYPVFLVKMG